MDLVQAILDTLTHLWGGAAQVINVAAALIGSGAVLGFLSALQGAFAAPLSWASAIAVFMILLEWIPTFLDIIQANLTGGGTKAVANGDSVGNAMRMPWSRAKGL